MSDAAIQQAEKKPETVSIEIDGVAVDAPKGAMIIEVADGMGIDIPRFCYHRKLTIAANCRMCLVDVEKAPKPLPACATPVTEGMKVFTESKRAVDAQHGVMEFLLINHPLDCPICDQGGECELQDLAMGYGRSVSRFTERKRVVKDKNIGPLVQTDMTRCIHCTRCVRFLEEIAGTAEMGGMGRGENLKIGTFIERNVTSELSGNIIDLCPVGALTNKPFRYSARAWELMARDSISSHDAIGSNVTYHAKRYGRIMRSVPDDNDAVNESWLSDRDRYSHFGLYSDDRLTQPMVKRDGEWRTVDWPTALAAAAERIHAMADSDNANRFGILMSGNASNEEYFLAQKLTRALGSNNIDHRLREADFSDQSALSARPAFALPLSRLHTADVITLVGCNPRLEAPILGHKVRQAWRNQARVSALNPVDYNFHFDLSQRCVVPPQQMVTALAGVATALGVEVDGADGDSADENQQAMASELKAAERGVLILGHVAAAHPQAGQLRSLARQICDATGAALCVLPMAANGAGAWTAGAVPHRSAGGAAVEATGLNAADMLGGALRCALLWNFEPDFDCADTRAALGGLEDTESVIAVSAYATDSLKALADVLLPLAPALESEGSFVNVDGLIQTFSPAGPVQGEARAGWKILRVLAEQLKLDGFDFIDREAVSQALAAAVDAADCQPAADAPVSLSAQEDQPSWRLGDVPIYAVDAQCRRATPLQQTTHGDQHFVGLSVTDAEDLGLKDDALARVSMDSAGSVELPVRVLEELPKGAVWVPVAGCSVRELGPAWGPLTVEAL